MFCTTYCTVYKKRWHLYRKQNSDVGLCLLMVVTIAMFLSMPVANLLANLPGHLVRHLPANLPGNLSADLLGHTVADRFSDFLDNVSALGLRDLSALWDRDQALVLNWDLFAGPPDLSLTP